MLTKSETIWMDGKLVPWDEANVHVLTHTLHYGVGVFEGIRCYANADGQGAVFRLPEHMRRLDDSAKILRMDMPWNVEQLTAAVMETLRANGLHEAYIRPLAFLGEGAMGLYPSNNPTHVSIAAWPWGAYLGDEGLANGIRARVSSYIRPHVNSAMTKAKACGQYINSYLAKMEAKSVGCDEALFLDTEGYLCEASGENVFIVRDGRIKTPPLGSVLPGITRDSVITIARDLGYELVEQRFTRDELYVADEMFMCGTAAEITPVREVDDRTIGAGKPGPVTKAVQETYFRAVKGAEDRYRGWLTLV